jgi:AraC-like DNA-binding protein
MNVSEIALVVGFDDSNYFSRQFNKYIGRSPRAFIKGRR